MLKSRSLYSVFQFFCLVLSISCNLLQAQDVNPLLLWYDAPAKNWNEALPLGNGKLGVMVFGNTNSERIQLNDDSLWPGAPGDWNDPEGTKDDLDTIRSLLINGLEEAADSMFVNKFSRKRIVRSHQTLGDLYIEYETQQTPSNYRRSLDISKSMANVSYTIDGYSFNQEVFVSKPHKAIVIQITTNSPKGIHAKIRLNRPKDEGVPTVNVFTTPDNLLIMQGEVTQRGGKFNSLPAPLLHGVKFETCLNIKHEGGSIARRTNYLELKGVKKATLRIVSNSSYYFNDFKAQNQIDLRSLDSLAYDTIKSEHIKDYQNLFSKVDFKLQPSSKIDTIPINQRLKNIKEGKTDLGLEALLFQYGRYLLIASSRTGTNPANLQGLWNEHIQAPWNADYHLNINLQMNYWPASVTQLDSLNYPLFDYIDRLVAHGKTTAKQNFGCQGTFIPHASDLWAVTWLRAPTAYWGCSVGAGGWLMQHYWQHYEFTQDARFLKSRAYPAMHEVVKFYSDWLIKDPRDGTLISAPSTSPENRYLNKAGNKVASCLGSAIDQQIIFEVFTNYLKACKVLAIQTNFTEKVKEQLQELRPGLMVGKNGRILEWDRPYEEPEPGHRHISHLYGFHPGNAVTKTKTPELFEAVKKTLQYRLEHGGAGTGWSRAWLINFSARLEDGDMAYEHIDLLLKKSISNNLFDRHPPFQIDGNFGYTAGVAEMLLQSHETGVITLLPALPKLWKKGHIKGLKARGGFTVSIWWTDHQLEKVIITSAFDSQFNLKYLDQIIRVNIRKGEPFTYNMP